MGVGKSSVGRRVAASLGMGERRAYRHRDLGFVVDLGGVKAAANPLGVHLSGAVAGAVTRGYHLAAMPGNRVRVAADWVLDAVLPRQAVQLGLVRSWSVPLDTASPELVRMPGDPERAEEPAKTGDAPAEGRGEDRASDPVLDPDAVKHPEPPGPVKRPERPAEREEKAQHRKKSAHATSRKGTHEHR